MGCCAETGGLLSELKDLVKQIGESSNDPGYSKPCCSPCCPQTCCFSPCTVPFAQVTMTCPPPCLAPTQPEPVRPLQLPCICPPEPPQQTAEEREKNRYDNFYNNYNIDWHPTGANNNCCCCPCPVENKKGKKLCEDYTKIQKDDPPLPGCPTGFKPCTMKLTPPPGCDPCGIWCAQIQPCPPKPKKKNTKYEPGPCTRPCCKHWKPKEGPCLYDDPCLAHCFNHPPGMKPSGRYP